MKITGLALSALMVLHLIFLSNHSAYAFANDKEAEKMRHAESAFNEIVNLWHDQKFDELYDRFAYKEKAKMSREKFISRMTKEKKRLACCWQKVQNVKVKVYSSAKAEVRAKFGFEDQSNAVIYVTAELPLYLKDEIWMVKVKDILDAAPDLSRYKSKNRKKGK